MADYETSVETQEVAEPVETTEDLGVEVQDIANSDSDQDEVSSEPTSGKTERDSAFAEMRRAKDQAERELAQFKAEQEARANALERLTGRKDAELEALADSLGIEVEDVIATIQADQRQATLEAELEMYKAKEKEANDKLALTEALNDLEKIEKGLPEETVYNILGYADKGMSIEDAYYAVKGKEIATKAIPPKEIGKVNSNKPMEKDFITKAEYESMSEEQIRANPDLVLRSSARW